MLLIQSVEFSNNPVNTNQAFIIKITISEVMAIWNDLNTNTWDSLNTKTWTNVEDKYY